MLEIMPGIVWEILLEIMQGIRQDIMLGITEAFWGPSVIKNLTTDIFWGS